jgi:protein-S-isoprenylcysteine O-methyltransferase Ste14
MARLPALGARGEGWVAGQVVLLAAVFVSAFAGGTWGGIYAPIVGAVLLALGVALLVSGAKELGPSLTPFPAPKPGGRALRQGGVYRLARHPIYGGGILVAFGWSLLFTTVPGLVLSALLAVFFDLKARREEIWLGEHFDEYDAYRRRTPRRLLPFVY